MTTDTSLRQCAVSVGKHYCLCEYYILYVGNFYRACLLIIKWISYVVIQVKVAVMDIIIPRTQEVTPCLDGKISYADNYCEHGVIHA